MEPWESIGSEVLSRRARNSRPVYVFKNARGPEEDQSVLCTFKY